MTFDLGLALCGLFVGGGLAVAGWRIAAALARRRTVRLDVSGIDLGVLAEAMRYPTDAQQGFVAPPPEPVKVADPRLAPFTAWKTTHGGSLNPQEAQHLEYAFAVLAGVEKSDEEGRRDAAHWLAAYRIPDPRRAMQIAG